MIAAKYIHGWPITEWIIFLVYEHRNISNIWRALLKALPILKQWLVWRPGNGWNIRVGRDPILGLNGSFRLSAPLLDKLLGNRIYFLAQAALHTTDEGFTGWVDAQFLNLNGALATEWKEYTYLLKNSGLCLNLDKDTLYWSKNLKSGHITAALAYSSSVHTNVSAHIPNWFKEVWHWKLPLKTILFSWLLMAERILTWDILQRRGFEGPGICSLCHDAGENINHLMINCPFTVQVWHLIGLLYNTEHIWNGTNISLAFSNWIAVSGELRLIPFHICRSIWLARNTNIFRNIKTTPLQIVNKLQLVWNEGPIRLCVKPPRIILPPSFQHNMSVGFFDGASQDGGKKCGVGVVLISPLLGRFYIKWNCGFGTNTRSELLALWSLLHFARSMGIDSLQIAGDSQVIVKWFDGTIQLEAVILSHWMERIRQLKRQFLKISIQHIYRENNREADFLSKQALAGPLGHFLVARGDGHDPSTFTFFGTF